MNRILRYPVRFALLSRRPTAVTRCVPFSANCAQLRALLVRNAQVKQLPLSRSLVTISRTLHKQNGLNLEDKRGKKFPTPEEVASLKIEIPDLPYKVAPHPLAERALEETRSWWQRVNWFENKDLNEKYNKQDNEKCAAFSYPSVKFDDLILLTKFNIWFFGFDEFFDVQELAHYDVDIMVGEVNAAFDGIEPKTPGAHVFWDIWQELKTKLSTSQAKMFREAVVERYLKEELRLYHLEKQNIPAYVSTQAYIESRRKFVGMYMYVPLHEIAAGTDLGPKVWSHPMMQQLINSWIDCIAFGNDLHSFKKEYCFNGDLKNLTGQLMLHEDIDVYEALERSHEYVTHVLALFGQTVESILHSKDLANRDTEKVVKVFEEWLGGYYHYAKTSPRYKVDLKP